jgi:hypothetical protein
LIRQPSTGVLVAMQLDGFEAIVGEARAFSSEADTGSREENASKQKARASVPIQSERRL